MSEKAGTVAVTVKRTGNLNQYAIVLCRTEQASATSSSGVGARPGQQDYVEYAGQVAAPPYSMEYSAHSASNWTKHTFASLKPASSH